MTDKKPKATVALGPARTGPEAAEARTIQRYGTAAAASGLDIEAIIATGKRMTDSGLMPAHIKTSEQAIIIGLKGAELGIPLMQSWSSMFVIDGRPSMEAKMMLALAYRLLPTFDMRIREEHGMPQSNREVCDMEFRRSKDHSWVRIRYTIEDAKAAGLTGKSNWNNHGDDMLRARVVAKGVRLVAPDTFSGLYTPDELLGGVTIEEGDDLSEVADATWEEKPQDAIARMTRREIVDAIKAEGHEATVPKARAVLEIPDDDKSLQAFEKIYRWILKQIDTETGDSDG